MRVTRSKKIGVKRELEDLEGSQEEKSQTKKQKITPDCVSHKLVMNPKKICIFSPETLGKTEFAENNTLGSIIQLPHPKSRESVPFLLTRDMKQICELKMYNKPYTTVLMPDKIISKPCIYMITPFDPIFFLISLLEKEKSENFCILRQILFDSEFNDLSKLRTILSEEVVQLVCDTKIYEDEIVCKFNKEKALSLLEKKVRKVAEKLPSLKSFQSSYESMVSTSEGALKYGISLVIEYLSNDLADSLATQLGFSNYSQIIMECEREVRKLEVTGESEVVKETSKKGGRKKQSRAKKILEKTDKTGMKSLSTFFTKQ